MSAASLADYKSSVLDHTIPFAPVPSTRNTDRNESQSVLRACAILKLFSGKNRSLNLKDVAHQTGLPKTTALRILSTLVRGGVLQKPGGGLYQCPFSFRPSATYSVGVAVSNDAEYSRDILLSLRHAAEREKVRMLELPHANSVRVARRNVTHWMREHVDLVIEIDTPERIASALVARYAAAHLPVVSVGRPQRGLMYFGADHYRAGVTAGQALARWASRNWADCTQQLMLFDHRVSGSAFGLRLTGLREGLRSDASTLRKITTCCIDGRGKEEQIYQKVLAHLDRRGIVRTLVGTTSEACTRAALRAFEHMNALNRCAVVGLDAPRAIRDLLRRQTPGLVGAVAFFPERYGDSLIAHFTHRDHATNAEAVTFARHQLLTPANVDLFYPLG